MIQSHSVQLAHAQMFMAEMALVKKYYQLVINIKSPLFEFFSLGEARVCSHWSYVNPNTKEI